MIRVLMALISLQEILLYEAPHALAQQKVED